MPLCVLSPVLIVDYGGTHVFLTLTDAETHIKKTYADKLGMVSRRITDLYREEKNACQRSDDIDKQYADLTKQVQQKTDQMVSLCKPVQYFGKRCIS